MKFRFSFGIAEGNAFNDVVYAGILPKGKSSQTLFLSRLTSPGKFAFYSSRSRSST